MNRASVFTITKAIASVIGQGASWRIMVRSCVKDTPLRLSLTTSDRNAEVFLKIGKDNSVILDAPDRCGLDTSDFYHTSSTFRTEFELSIRIGDLSATIPILDAVSTYNRLLGAWAELDDLMRDSSACAEACVSAGALAEAFTAIGLAVPRYHSSHSLHA